MLVRVALEILAVRRADKHLQITRSPDRSRPDSDSCELLHRLRTGPFQPEESRGSLPEQARTEFERSENRFGESRPLPVSGVPPVDLARSDIFAGTLERALLRLVRFETD